jgi:dienelactone hydrolase
MKWTYVAITMLLMMTVVSSVAQTSDPFAPWLTGQAPAIEEDEGITMGADSIRVQRLVFRSRDIQTPAGPQPSRVFAAIAWPRGKGPFPGLLRLHGGGGYADIAAAISSAKAGYVSLVLDIPGLASVKTRNAKTQGPWKDRRMITATPDVTYSCLFDAVLSSVQAFYLLRSLPGVDSTKMCVAGASWGGYTATMIAALLNKDITATWSIFGTGNFELGAYEKDHIEKLPGEEKERWLRWLDPGRRAHCITKPYFISTASNDRHWSWMAVQATIADIKGPVNQFYSPNDNHATNYPGNKNMIRFFDYYTKRSVPPLPKVTAGKTRRLEDGRAQVSFTVKDTTAVVSSEIYYADASPVWTQRKWRAAPAARKGKEYTAYVPADIAVRPFNWYAIVRDKNEAAWGKDSISCAGLIQQIR